MHECILFFLRADYQRTMIFSCLIAQTTLKLLLQPNPCICRLQVPYLLVIKSSFKSTNALSRFSSYGSKMLNLTTKMWFNQGQYQKVIKH